MLLIVISLVHFPMFGKLRHANIPIQQNFYDLLYDYEGATIDNPALDSIFLDVDDSTTVYPQETDGLFGKKQTTIDT